MPPAPFRMKRGRRAPRRNRSVKTAALLAALLLFVQPAFAKWDHIFVIMMENAGYSAIIGNPIDAPYINKTLLPQAALYTESFGVTHPSLPNYLALFSGDIQENPADTSNHCVDNGNGPFNAPNLYHSLTVIGKTVEGFFESMDPNDPMACGTGMPLTGGAYVQKHNPFAYFTSGGIYNVPITAWQPYTGPSRASWPNFAFIVPNIPNDMHVYDVSPGVMATISQRVRKGDTWLANNMPTLISYCRANNGLIILTMDEAERVDEQHIPTIVVGANVAGGRIVTQVINHYNVTKTITDNFSAPAIGHSIDLAPLTPPRPGPARVDFNGDGHPDYVLYNTATRQTALWYLNDNALLGGYAGPTLPANWRIADVADFNRDGHPDYALFNPSTLQTVIWYLSGPNLLSGAAGPTLPNGWQLVATADFNGDGHPDYLLYNPGTRQTALWYMNNNVHIGGAVGPTLAAGWTIAGAADFNRDGKTDYLLFNAATGQSRIVYLSGGTLLAAQDGPTIDTNYQLAGTSDFNGDGKPDYVLFNPSTGQTLIWYLHNYLLIGTAAGPTLPGGWTLAAP